MKTIVISSQKGGSAKSTLTAHLAVEAERAGDGPVWLIDTDQQGTLSRWHERRESETPQRMEVPFKALGKGLEKARSQSVAFCLIDTAPAISEQSAAIIALADLVVIPVQPSPADLWAVADTIELVKAAGKPFLFVLTKANAQANLTAQSVAALPITDPSPGIHRQPGELCRCLCERAHRSRDERQGRRSHRDSRAMERGKGFIQQNSKTAKLESSKNGAAWLKPFPSLRTTSLPGSNARRQPCGNGGWCRPPSWCPCSFGCRQTSLWSFGPRRPSVA